MLESMKVGKKAEIELVEFLTSKGYESSLNTDHEKRYEYDVLARKKNKVLTFEVKHDLMATKTGNVAIEYRNSKQDKPSGIDRTTADYWCHKIDGNIYICKVKDLLKFIEDNKPLRIVKSGGDNNADIYLYKKENFLSVAVELSTYVFK